MNNYNQIKPPTIGNSREFLKHQLRLIRVMTLVIVYQLSEYKTPRLHTSIAGESYPI